MTQNLPAVPRHPPHLVELAKRGAEARLDEVEHEIRLLLRLFPDLRDSFDEDELPVSFILAKGSGRIRRRRSIRRRKDPLAKR